jgi:D-alanyl-D-alanine carboxypeptidase (penicillin-binding protein 5/6)
MPGLSSRRHALALALLVATLLGLAPLAARPAAAAPSTPMPGSYALVDADRGVVLAGWNLHRPLSPASTTKLLTALTALERLPLDSKVPVSARAAGAQPSKIGMKEGEVWSLDDALHSLLIVSANDAAYAIGERTGGTLAQFGAEMTATALRLGVKDSTLHDPSGLDDATSVDGGNRMSAYDLAVVARNALAVPEIANTSKLLTYDFTGPDGVKHHLVNHNKTILQNYAGSTGLKTGFTNKAGRTLVASATRNGRTMIAVVMNVYDTAGWATRLLDQGFGTPKDAAGVGETVPPVRAVTADARRFAYAALPAGLGHGALATAAATAGGTATVAAASTTTTAPKGDTTTAGRQPTAPNGTGASVTLPTTGSASTAATSGGTSVFARIFNARNLLIAVVVILLTLFLLRRRAVRRQRARRLARRKALEEARRRRMIDVIEQVPVGPDDRVKVVPTNEIVRSHPSEPARRERGNGNGNGSGTRLARPGRRTTPTRRRPEV